MKKITKLDEYQKIAMGTLYKFINKERQLEYAVIALCGETGELANILKKIAFYKETSVFGNPPTIEYNDDNFSLVLEEGK